MAGDLNGQKLRGGEGDRGFGELAGSETRGEKRDSLVAPLDQGQGNAGGLLAC